MLRRLIFLSVLVYTVLHLTQSKAKRKGSHSDATARWESEGGAPASEPAA
jgi:hypothetical protein